MVTCKPSCPADKRYISDLGFTKGDFHAISWFTSWAVDADHGSNFSSTECMTQQEIMYDTTFILYYSILDHTCFKGILLYIFMRNLKEIENYALFYTQLLNGKSFFLSFIFFSNYLNLC